MHVSFCVSSGGRRRITHVSSDLSTLLLLISDMPFKHPLTGGGVAEGGADVGGYMRVVPAC